MHNQSLDFHRQEIDGKTVFLSSLPGLFASYYYPLALLVLFLLSQFIALWLLLAVGLFVHGFHYPRTYGVFYPLYFWTTALITLLMPVITLVLTLATGVAVSVPGS